MRVKYVRHTLLATALLAITIAGCSGRHTAAQRPAAQAPAKVPPRGDSLYLIANDQLMALDARTRAVLWADSHDEFYAYSAPVYDNGVVYAANDALFAFNATTGALLWRTAMSETIGADVILDQGVLYATLEGEQNGTGRVSAVRASDGKLLWTYDTHEDNLWSAPVAAGGVIYVASDDYAYALRAGDGALLWRFQTYQSSGRPGLAAPAVVNGVVYVVSGDGYLFGLRAGDGSLLWRSSAHDWQQTPLVAGDLVYSGVAETTLYALRASDGQPAWKQPIAHTATGALSGGILFSGATNPDFNAGVVYATQANDGAARWQTAENSGAPTRMTLTGGVLYVTTHYRSDTLAPISTGALEAFDPANGALLWTWQATTDLPSLPAVGP